ncbi:hypothetical protein RAD15_09040 [Bradyrhizobium sp. 14AA]
MKYALGLIAFAASCLALPTHAQSPATDGPIGLVWGSSSAEVQAKGVELKEIEGTDFGKSYLASKMEKALADQSAALLSFGFNDKLWRVLI